MTTNLRPDGRLPLSLRPINIECDINRYAEGSCLFSMGHTRVLCTVSVENKVPRHVTQGGWLTAEYAMLPRATHTRSGRDRAPFAPNSRGTEIQRLIGRSLRAMVDLSKLGENTWHIDCDVLQADGGTRVASINAGAVAIALAASRLMTAGKLAQNPILSMVAGISVCQGNGMIQVDPDYLEDSECDMDMNIAGNRLGHIIEIQGSAEGAPIAPQSLQAMINAGLQAQNEIFQKMDDALQKH